MLKTILFLLLSVPFTAFAQKIEWQNVDTKTHASFRGLSVISDSVAWVSGSNGWVGVSANGGKDWSFRQVKGFEKCDFRSLYAFDSKSAVIANAGAPTYIMRTEDGGATWQKVYENNDTAAFIDGIDFRDADNGIVYGDPISNHMLLLTTEDGGKTWKEPPLENRPLMSQGEASFAASGTCIKWVQRRKIIIATGGKVSRLFISNNKGRSWKAIATPILQGRNSTGIFSFLVIGKNHWVIAGGDYKQDTLRTANLFYTYNGGKTWIPPVTTTRGYRECLAAISQSDAPAKKNPEQNENTLLAAGPGGIDISYNDGRNWIPFSDEKQFHVVKKSRTGNLIVIAGGDGKVSILKPKNE